MKALRKLNAIALLIPVGVACIEMIIYRTAFIALVTTMITGFIQVLIAFALVANGRVTRNLIAYFVLTTVFFLTIWLTEWDYIWFLPPFLAIFLTFILYDEDDVTFLAAQWKNLLLINYEIDPVILEQHLPAGTQLDFHNGKCYLSLVGFMFENTRVCGMKVPRHINFEEVNIRFYVTRKQGTEIKRGVVFVKEIVPRRAITLIANLLYKEHYETLPMRHSITKNGDSQLIEYGWQKNQRWNTISAICKIESLPIVENTDAEFITEHYFGYTKLNANTTYEYEVTHPKWNQLEVIDFTIDVDFEANYGKEFAFLANLAPTSVFVAEGSEITVKNKVTFSTTNYEKASQNK